MKWIFLSLIALTLTGCAEISPFSPKMEQKIDNQDGKIDEIKSNQNGMMLEIMKLRQQNEINARDIGNFQQGLLNVNKSNSGTQILQGDGPLVLIFGISVVAMMLIYHYRSRAVKSEKTSEILAQQISMHNDEDLNDEVYLAALNTEVEGEVYHLLTKNKLRV